ncbi:methionyl-tRNA formyltransferase [Leptospira meyeri]|uniref:methionyl-tRNA formyltransferase n=1 Tax=Leptospira meyeri TaxID=29508 RepID=UPI000C29C7B2|nr:methionyl-tRNA formyltransferase [Leptospira meyeri]PJZ82545.1 methionyl-tRNA formyltransferase [Leptospira meyeri]PJZ98212.1 methionyl-tRNA formyltransferase [Leptospira meyeri]PKA23671.1 methionyl-tRNA formyltransferase [Leptospira sp. mixed culture ATI2-C-A1]TGM71259.1 methionyl-tRNA formyltransferase [Leptospira meyeri]
MKLSIGYFGSPEHSKELLSILIDAGVTVDFVVTNIDKPVGRKQIITPTPVKELAIAKGIPVIQSPKLRTDEEAQKQILSYGSPVHIVYAYGSIVPENVFRDPKFGSINLHGSLLPKYRGASPVQSFLLSGEESSGFTIQFLAKEVDSGDIISQKSWKVESEETTASLLQSITKEGGAELIRLLRELESKGSPWVAKPQNAAEATHCKKITASDRPITWSEPAKNIHNRIRALYPDPLAVTEFRGKKLILITSFLLKEDEEPVPIPPGLSPGSFFLYQKKRLFCLCGDGNLLGIDTLQPEGKKPMKGFEFFNGARVLAGESFT